MGLRLVAHYFDRTEAYIAWSVLDAAGIFALIQGEDIIRLYPQHEIAFGGFRLVTVAEELEHANAVLEEARRKPLLEGERFVRRHRLVVTLLWFLLSGFPMPLRSHEWREVE